MKTDDFDYSLPDELIAQTPLADRDQSRMLVLPRRSGEVIHSRFCDLPELLRSGDCLVLNNTRVIPARLWAHKETGARIELFFSSEISDLKWSVLVRNARRLVDGSTVVIDANPAVRMRVSGLCPGGTREVELLKGSPFDSIGEVLETYGEVPLPPYIHRPAEAADRENYQTVFATQRGAVAAPTAGLHFTRELLDRLDHMGVSIAWVTLHVGLGTFKPVQVDDPADHPMHTERYLLSPETVSKIEKCRSQGGRVIAVGTTSLRVLEHCAQQTGFLQAGEGTTDLKILPGYQFAAIDGLITNFHLPRTTLLMLVSALGGRERVLQAYEEAIRLRYRFFSYGDAMLLI